MIPDRRDLTPLNDLRETIGYYCEVWLRNHSDALDAADFLGLDKTDPQMKAKVLAIVAAFRARRGIAENSIGLLKRMEDECQDETEELTWARCRVAIGYLGHNEPNGSFAPTAVKWLCDMQSRAGDDLAAESCVALARYYSLSGQLSDAIAVLESGKAKYLDTARGAQILYALGCVLDRQGKQTEAVAAMKDLIERKPLAPFYSSLVEFFIEQQPKLGDASSIAAAIEQAEASYSPNWRNIAYCATDTMLDPIWMTTAQMTALVKNEFAGEAIRLINSMIDSAHLTLLEWQRLRADLLLFAMRSAPSLDVLFRRDHRMILPLLYGESDDDEIMQIRWSLIDAAAEIVADAEPSRCSADGKCQWITLLAAASRQAERRLNAVRLYKLVLYVPGIPHETQARINYQIAMCYKEINYRHTADAYMNHLVKYYADTPYGKQAQRVSSPDYSRQA